MTPVSGDTPQGRAFLDLRNKARAEGRATDELLQLYALEGFLARTVLSPYAGKLVLKGGVLLAAFGNRRPTRDIDLAGIDLSNDAEHVRTVVRDIAGIAPAVDDGLVFDTTDVRAEVIRESDEYDGVRVSMGVGLATAQMRFHVDVTVGDPIWPAPEQVRVPRLLGGAPIVLDGYPMPMVFAEKVVTAVQRGTASTRWRDFADVWTLSGEHQVSGAELQDAIAQVVTHRAATVSPLSQVLAGFDTLGQTGWATWRRKQRLEHLPERLADVLKGCVAFADPALAQTMAETSWEPSHRSWT